MKKLYSETIRFFKKIKTPYYIQFAADLVYMSDGHIIAKMPRGHYETFIIPNIPGVPPYTDGVQFTMQNGHYTTGNIDFSKMLSESIDAATFSTRPSAYLFQALNDVLTRAFIWTLDDGTKTGALINEMFFELSREYGSEYFKASRHNAPLYTENAVNDTAFLVLPVHYTIGSPFADLLDLMNRATA